MNLSVFKTFPEMETSRLLLQDLRNADPKEILELRSDPMILRFIDKDPAQSIEDALKHIEVIKTAFEECSAISWIIVEKKERKVLGNIGLWRFIPEHNRAEIGYVLKPQYWGKGLMKEAMDVIVRYGFKQLEVHSIEANINPANVQSKKVLEKCKFKQEAYFRENYFYNGTYIDSAIFSLLEKDLRD